MAIHYNTLFEGFSGSINRQLVFKQVAGKTVVCKFPDRSKVVYSQAQLHERVRFKYAVAFAKEVIGHPVLKDSYRLKALKMNLRSAWNAAIADYMSKEELKPKPIRVKFDKSIITRSLGFDCHVRLSKMVYPAQAIVQSPNIAVLTELISPLIEPEFYPDPRMDYLLIEKNKLLELKWYRFN